MADEKSSGWTVDTLKEHLTALLRERDKAVAAALEAVKEENRKTEIAAEKRFDLLNELRGDVVTRQEQDALEKVVYSISSRQDRMEGRSSGFSQGWVILLGFIGVVSTIGSIGAMIYALNK